MTNCYTVSRIDWFEKWLIATFGGGGGFKFSTQNLIFKCSEPVVSENNHALPENIVLMYTKCCYFNSKFKFSKSSFQENAKTKMYALEDSLGVYYMINSLIGKASS